MSREQAQELLRRLTYEQKIALLRFLETISDEKEGGNRNAEKE